MTLTARLTGTAVAVACLSLAAPALAHDPSASFTYSPAAPKPGQTVTFTSTSTYGAGDEHMAKFDDWDLDNDGEFDDGTTYDSTPNISRSFPTPGQYTVRMRTTTKEIDFPFNHGEDIETKTITVANPQPPAPPPTKPPVAALSTQCSQIPIGGGGSHEASAAQGCNSLTVQVGRSTTLDASPSYDPDGQIAKYEWDFTADGSYDRSTSGPKTNFTYPNGSAQRLRLRVTDNKGAKATVDVKLVFLSADCLQSVQLGRLLASAICMRKTVTPQPRGGSLTTWKSQAAVLVNGILVAPAPGRDVLIQLHTTKKGTKSYFVNSKSATVSVSLENLPLVLRKGEVDWSVKDNALKGFKFAPGLKVRGLNVTGYSPKRPTLNKDKRSSTMGFYLQLPKQFARPGFSPPTSGKAVTIRPGAQATASADNFTFSIKNANLGVLDLKELTVKYTGPFVGPRGPFKGPEKNWPKQVSYADFWEINAHVVLPTPLSYGLKGGVGIEGGKFAYAYAEVYDLNIHLAYGVFFQKIHFGLSIKPRPGSNPAIKKCFPKIGVQNVTYGEWYYEVAGGLDPMPEIFAKQPFGTYDFGLPSYALCGGIGLSYGPSVDDTAAIQLDVNLGFARYPAPRPDLVYLAGIAKIFGYKLADSQAWFYTNGYMKMLTRFKIDLDVIRFDMGGIFEIYKKRFNAEMQGRLCIDFPPPLLGPGHQCLGAQTLISSKGLAACMDVFGWDPGFGAKWNPVEFDLYFVGCDVGEYRVKVRPARASQVRAAGAQETVNIKPGLPGAVIALTGRGGPPKVTLDGPKGEHVEMPAGSYLRREPFFIVPDFRANTTSIAIRKPSAGQWKVTVADNSSPVTKIEQADGLDEPKVKARLTGRRHDRTLVYKIKPRKGQRVTFSEDGKSTSSVIGTAKGAKGRLRFVPSDGVAERRKVVANVHQNGLLRDKVTVLRFRAPGPRRPAKPKLRVGRRGSHVLISWKRSRVAKRYFVGVTLNDGRRLFRVVRGRQLVVRGVAAKTRGRVRVEGVSRTSVRGRRATARIKAKAEPRRARRR